MYSILQILNVLQNPDGLCRRLKGMRPLRDDDGRILFSAGNSAVVLRIELRGRTRRLRCYTRPPETDLGLIYGDRLLRQELYLHTGPHRGEWVDVVLDNWIPGDPLDAVMDRALATDDSPVLLRMSRLFDALAAELVADDRAHGDLKPENIVVTPWDELRLIDFDASYLPAMKGGKTSELGTPAYQHPARTSDHFDRWLDHYPAALISTQLRALSYDPTLHSRYSRPGLYLFSPEEILRRDSPAYDEVLDLLARKGDALHYRLACALQQPCHRLEGIEELFAHIARQAPTLPPDTIPESYVERGLCGFRTPDRIVIPPVYDEALEFHEGTAAVRLGPHRYFIDLAGDPVAYLPPRPTATSCRDGRSGNLRHDSRNERL